MYPNPLESNLTIEIEGVENQNYSIVNNVGQIVAKGQISNSKQVVDVSHLNPGIYLLKLDDSFVKLIKD